MSAMFALLLDVTTIFVLAAWLLSGAGALMPLPAAPPARSREALRLALLPAVGGGLVICLRSCWSSKSTAWPLRFR